MHKKAVWQQRIKFFSNSSIEGENYDKITNNYSGSVLGIPLPVRLGVETWRFYEAVSVRRDPVGTEKLGRQILTEQLQTMVEPYGAIRSTLCVSRQVGDTLEVTLTAECEEEIGQTGPILTEELGKAP